MSDGESNGESNGSDIPAKPIEDTKAVDEQVNGELQDKVEEESEVKDDAEETEEAAGEDDGV